MKYFVRYRPFFSSSKEEEKNSIYIYIERFSSFFLRLFAIDEALWLVHNAHQYKESTVQQATIVLWL